jgi:hypothetical protein
MAHSAWTVSQAQCQGSDMKRLEVSMGTWSHEPFGNDDACDWSYELLDSNDLSPVDAALDAVLHGDDYLEASAASNAVAAVEIIAKLLGKGTQTDAYTENVDKWVKEVHITPTPALIQKAKKALTRILGDNSELKELWQESGTTEWEASMHTLQAVLGN